MNVPAIIFFGIAAVLLLILVFEPYVSRLRKRRAANSSKRAYAARRSATEAQAEERRVDLSRVSVHKRRR